MRFPHPKRVVLYAAIATFVVLILGTLHLESDYFFPSGPKGYDAIRSRTNDYRLLTSTRNNLGLYNTINVKSTGHKIMNPTLLELPKGSKHDFLVIARAPHVDKEIKGKKYRLARQVATFVSLTYDNFGRPELTANDNWSKMLVEDFAGPEHHCRREPSMDKYIGPEDMKLFWTKHGAPMLIFTHQVDDPILCEGMYIIDARAAVPELVRQMGKHAKKLPPIQFTEPVLLRRQPPEGGESDPRYQREKNWAPIYSPFSKDEDEMMFMVEPSQLFRFNATGQPVQDVKAERDSAVQEPFPPGNEKKTWHSMENTCIHDVMLSDRRVHQSTPMLSLTLCKRGECEPHEHNTVMIGMVQMRYDPPEFTNTWYDHRIIVYSAVAPYTMLSVSKKLTYHGETNSKYIWTGSMVYHGNQPEQRSHGFLDDEVWLSFGIGDSAPGWLDVPAKELVSDHYFCQGATDAYRECIRQYL
ncbi:hypothetical protein BHE90_002466 [Fusarium euwallaceae]|uniref:Uncharacterized protein n=5 Tax=Fusarium solani species complex TaxID=232080 RepID=A0A3M2SIS6_9HYPO|nr:hypothetical protein CDV36_003115 [Fusarium kuroshium]RSL90946.1 hypothetical protein CEP51_000445 [Fusarium floridanum]RSL95320.1 hypothetical protein CEP52_012155 [Fusarium oligoseptatum]RSM19664.1 hypothetical protein CDV31_001551 [Fusarium ambrosium]RTE83028.1 hypothetical protein BHE90_002466 [Fusarium euwallaceae]